MRTYLTRSPIVAGTSRFLAALAIALGMSAQAATAMVLFDQTAPFDTGLRASSTLNFLGGSPGFRAADNFMLGSASVVGAIQWMGKSNSGANDFTFTFYADDAGQPGAVLLSSTGNLTTSTFVSGPEVRTLYSSNLNNSFSASAGTTYWLSVFNNAPDANWAWSHIGVELDGSVQRQNNEAAWLFPWDFDLNFALEGVSATVPAPASLTMVALGMLLLGRKSLGSRRARRTDSSPARAHR